MYGTIAKLRVKAGSEQDFEKFGRQAPTNTPGILFEHVFRMDDDPRNLYLVVGFENKEAYQKNAQSPEQHQQYLEYMKFLEAAPEWHDGEIVLSIAKAGALQQMEQLA